MKTISIRSLLFHKMFNRVSFDVCFALFYRDYVFVSQDPKDQLLLGPAYAITKLLHKTGLKLTDFDVFELHEAFAVSIFTALKN